ncbi:MAG: hypothetical protein LBN20_01005 [Endomicrobium sp.]|jgi:AcrR family transcriptional regulator|nr:hypothetical protein [Endomicrobium sp.]
MARPSKNIDKKLLEAGKAALVKKGIRGINIRAICAKHRINLGMFFYCFKSKKNFIKEIFISFIEDKSKQITEELANIPSPMDRMKKLSLMSIKLHKEKSESFESITQALDFRDKSFVKLRKTMVERWFGVFKTLADQCKEDGHISKKLDSEQALSIFLGGLLTYAKFIDEFYQYDDKEYYERINQMSDILESKIK